MNAITKLWHKRWTVPAVSGGLIVVALGLQNLFDLETIGSIFMVAAAVVAGTPIVIKAVRALFNRVIGIDLLVSVAAIGALFLGEFWESAAVTFLFAIGHALESATLNRTRSALAELVAVAPDVAVVERDGQQAEIPAASVAADEIVLVKNGAKVPVDGVVVSGHGSIDEASITGESIPAEKSEDSKVFAGTVSAGGFLKVRATGVGADTTLARIIHRVEEAQDAKARTAQFMDRFSKWYTPAIMVGAVLVWLFTRDVTLALTLLVIGCPGALVISIPVSVVAGSGHAARDGILIKGGEFLETSAKIDAVALDKTGTLTSGKPRLTDVVVLDPTFTRTDVIRWAALAEAGSEHPLARPILDAAAAENVSPDGISGDVEPVPGKGIMAVADGHRVLVGNAALLEQMNVTTAKAAPAADELAAAGNTPMIVAIDDTVAGVIAMADTLRPDAAQMIAQLHRAGVRKVVMLTGDAPRVAQAVAAQTGIDEVHAGLLPEDKLTVVQQLQAEGHTVAMVGDGVNDAPALASADIGVAMGAAGSAVAVETADIALMSDDLQKLPEAIGLAKRTVSTMHQNIAIAMVTVVALLAGVLFGGVTMAIGMLVHEVSVLVVIVNAMKLLRRHRTKAVAAPTITPAGVTDHTDAAPQNTPGQAAQQKHTASAVH